MTILHSSFGSSPGGQYLDFGSVDSKRFGRWCIILRITGFLDFVHRPVFYKPDNTTFRKLDLFPSSSEGVDTYCVGYLKKSQPQSLVWFRLALRDPTEKVSPPHLRTETILVSETLRSLAFRISDHGQSKKN
jgi:hypothetical protein